MQNFYFKVLGTKSSITETFKYKEKILIIKTTINKCDITFNGRNVTHIQIRVRIR